MTKNYLKNKTKKITPLFDSIRLIDHYSENYIQFNGTDEMDNTQLFLHKHSNNCL